MKPIQAEDLNTEPQSTNSSTEEKDCGCSKGMCPGTILAVVMLIGWGLWTFGTWVWGLIAG